MVAYRIAAAIAAESEKARPHWLFALNESGELHLRAGGRIRPNSIGPLHFASLSGYDALI
jgi:hypothetical protein